MIRAVIGRMCETRAGSGRRVHANYRHYSGVHSSSFFFAPFQGRARSTMPAVEACKRHVPAYSACQLSVSNPKLIFSRGGSEMDHSYLPDTIRLHRATTVFLLPSSLAIRSLRATLSFFTIILFPSTQDPVDLFLDHFFLSRTPPYTTCSPFAAAMH
jgi:hypothetical protein